MFRKPMANKTNGSGPKHARSNPAESIPPLLSEKLIAQLQGAVASARRRRMSQAMESHDTELTGPSDAGHDT
jgi:hypothetical protein